MFVNTTTIGPIAMIDGNRGSADQFTCEKHFDKPLAVGEVCAECGGAIARGLRYTALAPDSSVIHPSDPTRDGWRLVTACGPEHLQCVIDRAKAIWVDEQLWFGQLARVSSRPELRGAALSRLSRLAGLSEQQCARALAWNARCDPPSRRLPGGQWLPDDDFLDPFAPPTPREPA